MKKLMIFAALPLAILFQSCTKDELDTPDALPKNAKQMEAVKEMPQETPDFVDVGTDSAIDADTNQQVGTRSTVKLFNHRLLRWVDVTTLPKTRNTCVKYAITKIPNPFGPDKIIKTCIGWKLEKKYYYREAKLVVNLKNPLDEKVIQRAVDRCLRDASIVALIAGLKTGGTGAATAFAATIKPCILAEFGSNLVSVSVNLSGAWGEWE